MDLLSSPLLHSAFLEFTTSCNLKCSYCAVSQPDYTPRDMDVAVAQAALADLVTLRVPQVCISGHGETTALPNWQDHAHRLIDAGCKVDAISNLAKTYSTEELATLARFHNLVVSIDTIDIDLFKRLRRGGDLRRVLYNINAIRAEAIRLGITGPIFRWACVVCDRNVFGLPSLVSYGLALGIREFTFQNLVKMPEVRDSIDFEPLAAMSRADLARAPAVFDEIEKLIASHRGLCEIQPGLREAFAVAAGAQPISATPVGTGSAFRVDTATEGMTRDCLDPWHSLYVSADGMVKPCCVMWEGVGNLGTGDGLREIFNGGTLRAYRDSLLTGNLIGSCVHCHSRGWISVDGLKAKVQEYIQNAGCENAGSPSCHGAAPPHGIEAPTTVVTGPACEGEANAETAVRSPEIIQPLPSLEVPAPEFERSRANGEQVACSTSWRVTAPMRAIKRALGGRRRRLR